jgi:hypothetical protein
VSNHYTATAKTIKISITVDVDDFPNVSLPPPGTPNGKGTKIHINLWTPEGVHLRAPIKAVKLAKLLNAIKAAEHGGYVIVSGKLSPKWSIDEASAVFQPKPPPQATDIVPIQEIAQAA